MNDQVTKLETTKILQLAEQCLAVEGDFVELGCYRGDTSVLIGQLLAQYAKNQATSTQCTCGKPVDNLCKKQPALCKNYPNLCKNTAKAVETLCKNLWLYDSFAGLPEKTTEDNSGAGQNFQAGELFVTKHEVVTKLRKHGLKTASTPIPDLATVIVKKAWFDQLTDQDLPAQIAFAFLDGDLYSSIKTSLKLVVPRLSQRGIMIVHDYNNPELPGSSRAVDEFLRTHPQYRLTVHHSLAIITSVKR